MKKIFLTVMIAGLVGVSLNAHSDTTTSTTSILSKNRKYDQEGIELYNSNLDMKSMKRVGAGLVAGGLAGLIGLNIEINIEPENTFFLGLGTGKGFNTFNFGYKKNFESLYMSPYTKVGFSQWYNSSKSDETVGPNSNILRQVLSDNEIQNNKFNVNFLAGGAGLEYNQLEGDLSGLNLFGEVIVMADLATFKIQPTGSIGITYFY